MPSANTTETIIIVKEYDKLCILEKLLNNDTKLEKIVSNFIDYSIEKDNQNKLYCFNSIKDNIQDTKLFEIIIKLSTSIANDSTVELPISIFNNCDNIIKYVNQPYIPFLPNESYYSSS